MQSTIQYIQNELKELYPPSEIESFIRLILESVYGLNYTDQVLLKHQALENAKFPEIKRIVARLITFEPIQYILGETNFYDLKIHVTPSVLIPRPETEELVAWILEHEDQVNIKILDIGTGSGCIALALKSKIADAEVFGVDISEAAINLAKENAGINKLDVQLSQQDILNWKSVSWDKFDIIVSNPPYVRESEKKRMEDNVLKYEPGTALFVSDKDPLIFYRAIAAFAGENLNNGGRLYFEINEYLAHEMKIMLEQFGFKLLEICKDISGRDRMIRAVKE